MGESLSASCLTRWTNYGEKRRYCDATSHRSAEDHAPLELHLRDKAANKYVFGNFGVCAVSHPPFHNNETLTNLVSMEDAPFPGMTQMTLLSVIRREKFNSLRRHPSYLLEIQPSAGLHFLFRDIARGRHAYHSFLFPPVSYHVDWR